LIGWQGRVFANQSSSLFQEWNGPTWNLGVV